MSALATVAPQESPFTDLAWIHDTGLMPEIRRDSIAFLGGRGQHQGDGFYCLPDPFEAERPGQVYRCSFRPGHAGGVIATRDGHSADIEIPAARWREIAPWPVVGVVSPLGGHFYAFLRDRFETMRGGVL